MQFAFTLAASSIALILCAMQPAASQTQSAAPVGVDAAAAGTPSDAAEKHAKRTACLKDAKSRKLIGPQKTAFLKNCMSAEDRSPTHTLPSTS
jgi:hypothetical protein